MQDSAIQSSCTKIFIQWCEHHFVHWQKDNISDIAIFVLKRDVKLQPTNQPTNQPTDKKIFTAITHKNLQNDQMYAYQSPKKKDVTVKCTCTQLTISHWWHQSVSHKWLTLHQFWHLSITESRLVRSINHNVMLLQQFLTAIRQISSKFFIFLQAGAWVLLHRALKTINFSP